MVEALEPKKISTAVGLALQGLNIATLGAQAVAQAVAGLEPNVKTVLLQAFLAAVLPGLDAWLARRRARLERKRAKG